MLTELVKTTTIYILLSLLLGEMNNALMLLVSASYSRLSAPLLSDAMRKLARRSYTAAAPSQQHYNLAQINIHNYEARGVA